MVLVAAKLVPDIFVVLACWGSRKVSAARAIYMMCFICRSVYVDDVIQMSLDFIKRPIDFLLAAPSLRKRITSYQGL